MVLDREQQCVPNVASWPSAHTGEESRLESDGRHTRKYGADFTPATPKHQTRAGVRGIPLTGDRRQ